MSRAGIGINSTSSSLRRSLVWFEAEAPLVPTISDSPSPRAMGERSVTNSPSRYVGPITGTIIASATRPPGGIDRPSIPSRLRGSSEFQRVASNEDDRIYSRIRWSPARKKTDRFNYRMMGFTMALDSSANSVGKPATIGSECLGHFCHDQNRNGHRVLL